MELKEGASVAGRYKLERKLGVGGMGEVWAATQTLTRKSVALKFLRDDGAQKSDVRRRFLREARAACAVRHPNVVAIHDVIELDGGEPVMVMELLEGETLEQRLARDAKMPLADLAAVMLRVISAVGTAHALGIVHRDLKPENVFLSTTAEGVEVKVLDFGIAKLTAIEGDAAETGGLTSTGAMLGTPYYMSPEQAFGEKKIDHRADIWSLGIILYRGLTGTLPTRADNIGQILKIIMTRSIPKLADVAPELPPDVIAIVDRMLESDPAKRPADLREVKEVLERHAGVVVESFAAAAPVVAEVTTTTSAVAKAARSEPERPRRGAQLAIGAVALAAVAGTVVLFATKKPREPIAPAAPTGPAIAESVAPAPATATAAAPSVTKADEAPAATTSASIAPQASSKKKTPSLQVSAREAAATSAPPAATTSAKASIGGVPEKPNF